MDELSTEYELMTTSQYDYLMKVVLVGNESVGKTTFFKQFINQTDITKYNPSVGVDVDYKVINTKNKTVNLQIWDTTSLPRYRNIMSSYYRRANIIIIFYDITSYKSFECVYGWLQVIFENKPNRKAYTIGLIGTKRDLITKRKVPYMTAYDLAKTNNLYFKEVCLISSVNRHTLYDITNILEDLIWLDIEKRNTENIHYELLKMMSNEEQIDKSIMFDIKDTKEVNVENIANTPNIVEISDEKCCFIC